MTGHKDNLNHKYGKQILSLFDNHYIDLKPQFAAHYQPINNIINSIEDALIYWSKDPGIYRRKNNITGSWYISTDISENSYLNFQYNWSAKINWYILFQDIIKTMKINFGYMHVFTEKELEPAEIGSAIGCFTKGTPAWALRKNGIPQLAWANYWSEEYTQELTDIIKRELSPHIKSLNQGYIFHLTENIEDIINDYENFDRRRQHIKRMFRTGLFQNYARYEHESKAIFE